MICVGYISCSVLVKIYTMDYKRSTKIQRLMICNKSASLARLESNHTNPGQINRNSSMRKQLHQLMMNMVQKICVGQHPIYANMCNHCSTSTTRSFKNPIGWILTVNQYHRLVFKSNQVTMLSSHTLYN